MTIQLFITCLIDSFYPSIGEAVFDLLHRLGLTINFPQDQTCCGQPAFNAGYWDEAKRMARHTISVLSETEAPVIVPSGSCAAMIRHGYLELFADDGTWLPRARELAARSFELTEFIVDRMGVMDVGATHQGRLAYHPNCHLLRTLGVDRQPLTLLSNLRDAEVQTLPPDCCGFGGVFALDHEPISSEMLKSRIAQITASGAETVVACDTSCLTHIEGGLRRAGLNTRCAHIAQVLSGAPGGLR